MRFKFKGSIVKVKDDELICEDELTQATLTPLFNVTTLDGPEYGDSFLNLITQAFGTGSVTDFEADAANIIY